MDSNKQKEIVFLCLQETSTAALIDRTIPKILNDYTSQTEWESFCDQIDNALSPIAKFKRQRRILTNVLTINCLILFLVFVITQVILDNKYRNMTDNSANLYNNSSSSNIFQTNHPNNTTIDDDGGGAGHRLLVSVQPFNHHGVGNIMFLSLFIITCILFVIVLSHNILWRYLMGKSMEKDIQHICSNFVLQKAALNFALQRHRYGNEYKMYTGDSYCCCVYDMVFPLYIEITIDPAVVSDGTYLLPAVHPKREGFFYDDEESPAIMELAEMEEDGMIDVALGKNYSTREINDMIIMHHSTGDSILSQQKVRKQSTRTKKKKKQVRANDEC